MRAQADSVLIGINTVIQDNPLLNVRYVKGKEPVKIIIDENCRIPLNSRILRFKSLVYVAATKAAARNKIKKLEKAGVKVLIVKAAKGLVDLKDLMRKLPPLGICSVMIEGGSSILTSALKNKLVDKIVWFVAPKITGGDGLSAVGALGIDKISKTIILKGVKINKIEDDLMIEGDVEYN
jgi:diaminohydroxyphosphoribosylaminopyrimidine deaminase/5-amino-6-(5-phosphoribosylamino)uracil reductase